MSDILIVESNLFHSLLYIEALVDEGHKVIAVDDAQKAVDLLKDKSIELLIIEPVSRESEEFACLQEIVSRHRRLKIIVNTASAALQHDYRSWCADRLLIKSSDLSELTNAIDELLNGH